MTDFPKLSDPEQSFVKMILAFFASADAFDIKLFFVIQTFIEAFLTAIVKDKPEVSNFPSIKRKIDWMRFWTNSVTRTFAERLIAFAALSVPSFGSRNAAFSPASPLPTNSSLVTKDQQ